MQEIELPIPATVATTYTYDNDGNLSQKTMPAQNQQSTATVTLTYCYDALNRLTQKGYTAQTCTSGSMPSPVATYFYDQTSYNGLTITNGIGRRTGMSDAAGAEAWSYDVMGRPLVERRTTNSVTKNATYTYLPYVDGSLYQLTYPSGRTITYAAGGAGRPLSAVDTANSVNYALSASYAPQGALASTVLGQTGGFTGINLNFGYDKRLQPTTIRGWSTNGTVLDLAYNFNLGTADNGNVSSITNNRDSTRSQTFTYDALNRLLVAETTSTYTTSPGNCWGETYVYDNQSGGGGAWGNLTNINVASTAYNGCTQENLSITANAQNRIGTSGYVYDTAGNLTNTPNPGGVTAQYNAENQLTNANATGYTYDGDGKRVQKSSGTLYWYGMNSDALDETDGTGNLTNEYVLFGGKRIARRDSSGSVFYYFEDHLGSSRVITNATGSVCYDADFYPFGGERTPIVNTCPQNYKFTAKERDSESGLDNFGKRYDASSLGRFMTTDPVVITTERLMNPQQLNLYAYVANNPLRFIDPTGEILQCVGNADQQKQCFADLEQIAGDAANRLSMDAKTGVISFDTKDLDLSKNEGASLVNDLVGSKNTYDFSIGPTIMTDKGPVRIDVIGHDLANLPAFGDQRQIGNPPSGVSDILGLYLNNPNIQRVSNTKFKVAPEWTVAFHELAEAYAKIDGGKGGSYAAGHNAALQRELELRDQRPYLKEYNTGAGGPANSPNPEGGIIIKK